MFTYKQRTSMTFEHACKLLQTRIQIGFLYIYVVINLFTPVKVLDILRGMSINLSDCRTYYKSSTEHLNVVNKSQIQRKHYTGN